MDVEPKQQGRAARRLTFWALYLTVVLAAVLGAAELTVRWLGVAPVVGPEDALYVGDSLLPHRLRPRTEFAGRSRTDEFAFRYAHNSLGFRDEERLAAKPPGVFRIIVLGDSFAYGIGVDFDETISQRLQRMFGARDGAHPRVEVLNAGIPRYYPAAELGLLERDISTLEPDLVLALFVPNDVIDTYFGSDATIVSEGGYLITSDAARLLAKLPAPLRSIERHSHLTRWMIAIAASRSAQRRKPIVWQDIYQDGGFHEASWLDVEQDYTAMIALTEFNGARLVLAHIPQHEPRDSSARYPGERLARLADRQAVRFIDLLEPLRAAEHEGEVYWPRDGHLNGNGTRIVAEALYSRLSGLVP